MAKRPKKNCFNTEGLVGVITRYDLPEKKYDFLGMFEGNKVYKIKSNKNE